jgi:8-oxo-dGTP pyrophosphatase MutT (NUDIX family)
MGSGAKQGRSLTEQSGSNDDARAIHRVAATVVLMRDSVAGPEVLMLERPHDRGSFAGAWVFPGGSVDLEDGLAVLPERVPQPGEERAARRAAVREVREETALDVGEDDLHLVSCWTPPPAVPKRFRTWFYYAQAPAGDVVLSPEESIASRWMHPADAFELHAAGALSLVPPTWVTLHAMTQYGSVDEALRDADRRERTEFVTRRVSVQGGHVFMWHGDIAYTDEALVDAEGARHRLDTRVLPWTYQRTNT